MFAVCSRYVVKLFYILISSYEVAGGAAARAVLSVHVWYTTSARVCLAGLWPACSSLCGARLFQLVTAG